MSDSLDLFTFPTISINKKIRLIELFAGVGSQAMALRDLGVDFEHWFVCEWDKYAMASYNAIHGTKFETTDIKNIHGTDLKIENKEAYTYLLTYSFPCTDLSVAGKMEGMSKKDWEQGNSTRSGLLWEVERILKELPKEQLPDVLVMENVPQVHAEQNRLDFDNWCEYLRSRGYVNHWKDLNARDFGIPQNRERCFMVSILSDEFIDFEFPKPVKLEKVMKDFLEKSVDEKYYINNEKAEKLIEQLVERGVLSDGSHCKTVDLSVNTPEEKTVANCITSKDRGIHKNKGEENGVVEMIPINTEIDGTAMTIKANYAKMSVANFARGNTFGATGVISCQTEKRN